MVRAAKNKNEGEEEKSKVDSKRDDGTGLMDFGLDQMQMGERQIQHKPSGREVFFFFWIGAGRLS